MNHPFPTALGALALLVAPAGCGAAGEPAVASSGTEAALTWESLRFDDGMGERLGAARAALDAAHPDWQRVPLARHGGALSARWVGPELDARTAALGVPTGTAPPGGRWAELGTFCYADRLPGAFGLSLDAGDLGPPLGARVTFSLRGHGVDGSQLKVQIYDVADGKASLRFELGNALRYRVSDATFSISIPADETITDPRERAARAVEAELGALLASPESLAHTATARLDALLGEVRRGIGAHEAYRCEYGKPPGGGRPPPCKQVTLTAEQEAQALAAAEAEIGGWIAGLARDAGAIHQRLSGLVPAGLLPGR